MRRIVLAALIALFAFPAFPAFAADKGNRESAYDRVMRTGTIRCGYGIRTPLLVKDPNTGVFSGLFYDYVENIAKALGLKVEWTEEIGWGDIIEALRNNRVDAFCSGLWPVSRRVVYLDFVKPVIYEPLYLFARNDYKHIDPDLSVLNSPDVTFVGIEGSTTYIVAERDFPRAKKISLPQLSPVTDGFMNVITGKADVVIADLATAAEFEKNNPGKLRSLRSERPVRAFGLSIAVDGNEDRLKRMLDLATEEFLQTGTMDTMLDGRAINKGSFLRVREPYEAPK